VSNPEHAVCQRIRELRRRHFGARGAELFAQRLGVPLGEYRSFERNAIPPGEVLVRMCELTGEDLQWLLTGVAGRGTIVISGTRGRHQELIGRLAHLLDDHPELAAPVEAFVELLHQGERARTESPAALPAPRPGYPIPLYEPTEVPLQVPLLPLTSGGPLERTRFSEAHMAEPIAIALAEPSLRYEGDALHQAQLITIAESGSPRHILQSGDLTAYFAQAFGMWIRDDTMAPMFQPGDAVVVAPDTGPRVGRPALLRVADEPAARCRIWLGGDDQVVHLGRVSDGQTETIARPGLRWTLEVLFRAARAA
jgi:hypothetical protein